MKVLGISAFYHDAAAALIVDGEIIAAAHEERFSRKKHDPSFPAAAIRFCLGQRSLKAQDLDAVVFYEKPILKFDRIIESYLAVAPAGLRSFLSSFPTWMGEKLNLRKKLLDSLVDIDDCREHWQAILRFSGHHLSHAASAFYPSPFDEAAVITLDGVGEWTTAAIWKGQGENLEMIEQLRFPHSPGLLYAAFTEYLGFQVNDGEYKVMGLAAYGTPRFRDLIRSHLVRIHDDGSFQLDMRYFDFIKGLVMTSRRFHALFGQPPRRGDMPLTAFHHDVAASVQSVIEEIVAGIARRARTLTGMNQLCMAGGVALNCRANGALWRDRLYQDIWVQPAAGDAGGAPGAALAWYHLANQATRPPLSGRRDRMSRALLGPSHDEPSVIAALQDAGLAFRRLDDEALVELVATTLSANQVVGWFQGAAEFGPRALGARSILASASDPGMKEKLNRIVKRREGFRPFAPCVLAERAADWFDLAWSPYMLFTARVLDAEKREMIPAAVHVDGTCRLQSVDQDDHPLLHRLLQRYESLSGIPVLLNTSFNVKDEPIVNSPQDAIRCMQNASLDMLVMGNLVVVNPA